MVAWASTLYALGRADEQAQVLEELRENCISIFGPDHQETHVASIKLANARLAQGRVKDAKKLCNDSVDELKRLCKQESEDLLEALNVHAKAELLTGTPGVVKDARDLYHQTWQARRQSLGPEHVNTLESRQLYYATSFWDGSQERHIEAKEGMDEIVNLLIRIRGREHPLTLLAMLYLARVQVELQDYEGAQAVFDYGLPVATRNFHEYHMAVLFCRYHIGRMRVRQARWLEARDILVDVARKQCLGLQGWGRDHYDRIGSLIELARAHHELGENDLCGEVVREALQSFSRIADPGHPREMRLRDQWESWKRQRQQLVEAPGGQYLL